MPSFYFDEFVDPTIPTPKSFVLRAEHLMRYIYAKNILKNNPPHNHVVYDIACGNGYGTQILASVSKKVLGADISRMRLSTAKHQSTLPNITFFHIDLEYDSLQKKIKQLNMPTPTAIVCFETLEHIRNPEQCMDEFYAVLPKGGLVLYSVPNATWEPKKHGKSKNVFHKQVLYPHDIISLATHAGFHVEKIVGQPLTNILLHTFPRIIRLIDQYSTQSLPLFTAFSYLLAYPIPLGTMRSYSYIVVARK